MSLVILNSHNLGKDTTLIGELGPEITNFDWQNLRKVIFKDISEFKTGCISGRLPQGVSCEEFLQLIQDIGKHGIPL
jgi:fructose-1-phosphate kinase PfkB-like protein